MNSFKPYVDEQAEIRFPSRQLRWAKQAAKTLRNLSIRGATALYFDGSAKAYTPDMFEQLDVNDHATLFHLFVEIWCEQNRVMTEGMNIFGLPDICVLGFEANSPLLLKPPPLAWGPSSSVMTLKYKQTFHLEPRKAFLGAH